MSDQQPALQLELLVDDDLEPPPGQPSSEQMTAWATAALSGPDECSVCVRVVGLDAGQALNMQYRQRDYATNVLSFPADMPAMPGIARPLGDLVLCAPVIAREAVEQGKSELSHWAHMLVHGMLHLQGMDHETDAEAHAMESLEVRILGGFGLPDPYLQPIQSKPLRSAT